MKRHGILTFGNKLLLSYLFLVILPMFLILTFVVMDMTNSLQKEERTAALDHFQHTLSTADNYFSGFMNLARSLTADPDLTRFLQREYPEGTPYQRRYQDAVTIQNTYSTRLIYESLGGNTFTIKTGNHHIICAGTPFEYFSQEDISTEWYAQALESPYAYVLSAPTRRQGYQMLPISCSLTPNAPYTNMLLIETRIDHLNRLLQSDNANRGYLLVNHKGIILASENERNIGQRLMDTEFAWLDNELASASPGESRQMARDDRLFTLGAVQGGTALTECWLVESVTAMPSGQLAAQVLRRSAPFWGITLVLDLMMIVLTSRRFSARFSRLVSRVRGIRGDGSDVVETLDGNDEIAELSGNINGMVGRINELIRNVYRSELEARNAEINALQSQINPHFLFNCLQAINTSAMKSGAYDTSDMIVVYSRLIRQSIEWKDGTVPLREELSLVTDYLKIQSMRFADRLCCTVNVDEAYSDMVVPKFCIQPLVENAIVHGVEKSRAHCRISVTATRSSEFTILVEDNCGGIDGERLSSLREALTSDAFDPEDRHIGIINVHQRIRLLYGPDYGVTLESTPGLGTCATIHLPAPR